MRVVPLLFALGVFVARGAAAQEPAPVPFRVQFSGGLSCNAPQRFSDELLERSAHVRPARADEPGFAFRVDVREQARSMQGRLTLREPDGRVTVRNVAGATCSEVISALAVIAAVLVEPSATAERPESSGPAPSRAAGEGLGLGANVGFVVQGGVAPQPRPGVGFEANLDYETGSFASPLFALAYQRTLGSADAPTDNGTAQLEWWTVRASLCPVRWPETGRLALRPCGLFDLGRLEGTGTATENRASAGITWVAPGASVRLDAAPVDWLAVTVEAGVLAPLNRDRFVFDPGLEAYRPPGVGGLARLALGGRFQ